MPTSNAQSSIDSTANSTGESVVTSQSVADPVTGKTPSDVASAMLRESAATLPHPFAFVSNPISTAAPAVTGAGLAPSGADSVVTSSYQSVADSRAAVTPIPVTTNYEIASASVLLSELKAVGWQPGQAIQPFLIVSNSAAQSNIDSEAASKVVSKAVKP